MKKISMFLCMFFLLSLLFGEIPEWVLDYQKTGSIKNQKEFYFGIGIAKNQKEADRIALTNFGMSIETKVKSEINSYQKEKNGRLTESVSKEIEVSSDTGLKGVTITERYIDGDDFYSIIKYDKEEYNKILKEEIKRELERKKMALKKEIEENKIKEREKKEKLRTKKAKQKLNEKVAKMRESYRNKMRIKFPDFFDSNPPYKAVSIRNGELIPQQTQINVKAGLAPISLEEVFVAYKLWLLEFSATASFYDSKYNQQQLQVKYQILPYSGSYYKFSAAFGFTAYKSQLITSNFLDTETFFTPFIAGNLTVPELYFSYISVYSDLAKSGIAITNYCFYKQFKDKIRAVLEVNLYYKDEQKNRFDDTVVIQPALSFKTTESIYTTLSFESNEFFILGIEVGF